MVCSGSRGILDIELCGGKSISLLCGCCLSSVRFVLLAHDFLLLLVCFSSLNCQFASMHIVIV